VDNLPDNQMLKGLKVWPVTEIVTYGFNYAEAPLHTRGELLFFVSTYAPVRPVLSMT
jgi:hypothetical protein